MTQIHEYLQALQMFSGEVHILHDEIMARHTTFRIGGPAQLFLSPSSLEAMNACVLEAKRRQIPCSIIGNGSNLLVSDMGINGVVICTEALKTVQVNGITIRAQAGILLSKLAKVAMQNNLTGLEFAAGIPGTVGGAVFMNAGAYDGQMQQIVKQVTFFDAEGKKQVISANECEFGYRSSIFKQHPEWSIVEIELQLSNGDEAAIRSRMDELAQRRREKQPLDMPSAGSTFKRPEGYFAGALIEQAGMKGFTVGGAQVSEKHAGFVVNRGGATSADVKQLIDAVREKVRQSSGVTLECEIRFL